MTLQVYEVPIKDIKPAAYNPRVISEAELAGLKESIKKFGFVEPLVVNKRSGNLCGGHQRLKAAELLGYSNVPVAYVDLSDAEEKALNVALNSHTIQGKFDLEILPTLLEELKVELPELVLDLRFDQLEKDLRVDFDFKDEQEKKDEMKLLLEVQFTDKEEMGQVYKDLLSRGHIVKIK